MRKSFISILTCLTMFGFVGSSLAGVTATDVVCTGCVNDTDIVSGAVTELKLATDAVSSAKIADGAVTDTKISSNAVTTAKIAESNHNQ